MAYQDKFWKGESKRTNSHDKIRGNPEAPPMHGGPGEQDTDMPSGADAPKLGSSQPKARGNKRGDELPLKHANVHPRRRQVLMAHALRTHSDDGTTFGTAIGGGAAGGGAGE